MYRVMDNLLEQLLGRMDPRLAMLLISDWELTKRAVFAVAVGYLALFVIGLRALIDENAS